MKAKDILLLTWKKALLIIGAWIVSVVLHNAIGALFGFEEALFFIIAIFVIPIYVVVAVVYSVVYLVREKNRS